ncbi:hypothetical protein BDV12DRAFT_190285 [Aspergillus spectabilis]
MEVADSPYNTQQTASNESSKTPPPDVRVSLALPGEFPPSDIALFGPERVHQVQMLEQSLDGQAEPSPAMARAAGTVWALAQRYPICIRIPSTLSLVMRFLPKGVKRSINLRDRADVARVFVALVNCWLSAGGGEGALTTRGTMRQLPKAEKSGKTVEMKSSPQSLPKFSTSLRPPLVLDQVRTVLPYLSPPQLECAQLWIDEARILQDSSFTLVTLVERMWGLTYEEAAFARLRIHGPFTMDWMQRAIPDLCPTQMVLAQWIVEHNRLMMECPKPVVSGLHRTPRCLITPDILAGLLGLSAAQRRRVSRWLHRMGAVWVPTGQYPYTTADRLWSAAMRIERRWWRSLWSGRSHERPVTLNQVIGVFPRLEPDAVDQVAQFLKRRAWRVGRASATLEDVMLYLLREKHVSDADMHYARRRLDLEQEHMERLQAH